MTESNARSLQRLFLAALLTAGVCEIHANMLESQQTKMWKAPTKLTDLRITGSGIMLHTQGKQAQYKTFEIGTPPKVVVELYDTWIPADLNREWIPSSEVQALGVEKIRVAQFANVPQHITRVVVDMARPIPYTHKSEQSGVLLRFNQKTLEKIEEKDAAIKTAPVRVDILKNLPTDLSNVNFQETELEDALTMLIEQYESLSGQKINLILADDVKGTITLKLENVPFNEIFQMVLASKDLLATQSGSNILKIMGKSAYQKERKSAITSSRLIPINYTDPNKLRTLLQNFRRQEGGEANIIVADEINSLIITDTEEGLAQLEKLIKQLDVRPMAVSIETKIVDLKLDDAMDFGIEWKYAKDWDRSTAQTLDKRRIGSVNPNSATPIGGASGALPGGGVGEPVSLTPGLPAFNTGAVAFGRVTRTSFFTGRLAAGIRSGKVKLLSNPRIVTLNNQSATINVGTQVPVPETTVSPTGTTQNIRYAQTGISLTVKPTINPDRYVRMELTPTVSRPGSLSPNIAAPPIDQRTATTVIITKDGETVVIGGLIDETADKQVTKVPILGDLPLLGWLFKRVGTSKNRTELMVFVTPSILD